MITLLLGAEAALDGGSEVVHGLPRSTDPLAHRVDRAPEGPHVFPPSARSIPAPVGARRRQPHARWGLMASGEDEEGRGRGEMSQKTMAAAEEEVELQEREREREVNSSGPKLHGPCC